MWSLRTFRGMLRFVKFWLLGKLGSVTSGEEWELYLLSSKDFKNIKKKNQQKQLKKIKEKNQWGACLSIRIQLLPRVFCKWAEMIPIT